MCMERDTCINPKTTPAETEPRDGGARGRAGNLPDEGETAQRGATRRIEMYERQGEQSPPVAEHTPCDPPTRRKAPSPQNKRMLLSPRAPTHRLPKAPTPQATQARGQKRTLCDERTRKNDLQKPQGKKNTSHDPHHHPSEAPAAPRARPQPPHVNPTRHPNPS